jgi:hypothetical protein
MIDADSQAHAAGVASWLALKNDCSVADIDINQLRNTLADGGSVVI